VALSPSKTRYGQPLENGVPGAGLDRRQAARAWEVALRLKEQAIRLRVDHDITHKLPESAQELRGLEEQIQATAKRLALTTNIHALTLEALVDALERYHTGVQIVRPWQV